MSAPNSTTASFVTTEHLTLQSARSQTVAESTGRGSMFFGAVSAGLVGLGLMATASRVGTAFYAFALILLPSLALVGFATFSRTLQTGIEDYGYARRIVRLRAYYFDNAPELVHYLARSPPEKRLEKLGLWSGRLQGLATTAGTVAVVTSVIAGAAAGLAVSLIAPDPVTVGLACGFVVTISVLWLLLWTESVAWKRVANEDSAG